MPIPPIVVAGLTQAGIAVAKHSLPKVVEAYVVKGKVDKEVLTAFINHFQPTIGELSASLKSLSADQALVATKAIEVIEQAIAFCNTAIKHCDTPEERMEVYSTVVRLAEHAKEVAHGERRFRERTVQYLVGAVLVSFAIMVMVRNPKAGSSLMQRASRLFRGVRIA